MDILKAHPEVFLFQAGYLTFGDYKNNEENTLKIPNQEVELSLKNSICETLKITGQFTVQEFEEFLGQIIDMFNLLEKKNEEDKNHQFNKIKSTMEKLFALSIKKYEKQFSEFFNQNTREKVITNIFCYFLNNLRWTNWSVAYQPEIFKELNNFDLNVNEKIDSGIRKPDFVFSNPREETEIIIEFMKSNWKEHKCRKYWEKTKKEHKKNCCSLLYAPKGLE